MNQTNSEMPISSFTLNELITMAGGEKRPGIMGECIAANSASEMEIFRFPSRLNALIIGVGTEGETSLTSNLQEFRLKKDSLFIFSPKHILQVQSNNRFKAHLIVIAPDFLKRINIDTKRMMPLFLQFGSLPCMELTHAESQSLRSFISMVEQELKGSETDFSSEIIGGLIAATIYKVGDILTHYLTEHPEVDSPIHNRAEEYFRQFTELLGEHYKHERSVGFYARQLCITPKYLTTLIKRIGIGMDRQLRDPRSQDAAQIFEHERAGNRLLPEFPQPVVLRQLLQAQCRHVAVAVQGEEVKAER